MLLTLPQKTLETFKIPQCEWIGDRFIVNPNKPPWPKRAEKDIKYLVVHHSASTGTLESENRYHTQNNNWYKLSYHFSIDRGHIYQINDILDITAHAMGANTNGIGICVNWDLRKRGLTSFEQNSLNGILLTLKGMFPNAEIVGHNEISKRLAGHITECPVIDMKKVRSDFIMAEQDISKSQSKAKKKELAFRIANELLYLYNLSKGTDANGKTVPEGTQDWGVDRLLLLEEPMRKNGMLK